MFGSSRILAFHQTSNRFYPGINNIRPGYFFAIIELLREWGLIPWNGDETVDANAGGIVITFDDGYEDNFDVLIGLCGDEISPILFIPADFIGKVNTWEYSSRFFAVRHLGKARIRELAEAGTVIGSHGCSHRSLTGMDSGQVKRELHDSKCLLEDITGRRVD